jgi:hypothetical protein
MVSDSPPEGGWMASGFDAAKTKAGLVASGLSAEALASTTMGAGVETADADAAGGAGSSVLDFEHAPDTTTNAMATNRHAALAMGSPSSRAIGDER